MAEKRPLCHYSGAVEELRSGDSVPFDVADKIHAATEKTLLAPADELGLVDTEASNALKKITIQAVQDLSQDFYPPAQSDTYVKATTKLDNNYWPYFATDPTKAVSGSYHQASWMSVSGTVTNQRFHIDLGTPKIINTIYYENGHNSGGSLTIGVKDFTLWGSNTASAFAELTYATDTDWTQLSTGATQFEQHVAVDAADPKFISVNSRVPYRYYAFKFATCWGGSFMGLRRIELLGTFVGPDKVGIGNTAPTEALEVGSETAGKNAKINATLGAEMAPSFDAANWTATNGWSADGAGTQLTKVTNAAIGTITPSGTGATPVVGTTYKIVITASATSGAITYTYGGVVGTTAITATTITNYITAATTGKLIISGAIGSTATITAVSIKALTSGTGDLIVEGDFKLGGQVQSSSFSVVCRTATFNVGDWATSPDYGPIISTNKNSIVFPVATYWGSSSMLLQNSSGRFHMRGDNGAYFQYYDGISTYKTAFQVSGTDRIGNVMVGDTTATANFQVSQRTAGPGKVSVGAGGTDWTGVGTQFLVTFNVGDTITSEGQTLTILTIPSNTSLTTAAVGAAIVSKGYTLTGGTRFSVLGNGNVGIGTASPAASAILDLTSTTKALLVTRLTTAQRNALTAVNGMVIYNSDTTQIEAYQNGSWAGIEGPTGPAGGAADVAAVIHAATLETAPSDLDELGITDSDKVIVSGCSTAAVNGTYIKKTGAAGYIIERTGNTFRVVDSGTRSLYEKAGDANYVVGFHDDADGSGIPDEWCVCELDDGGYGTIYSELVNTDATLPEGSWSRSTSVYLNQVLNRITWAGALAAIKTYFDGLTNWVTSAMLRNSAALSVIGRSANSAGVPADIAGTDGQVLRVSGTTLGFGTVVAAGLASDAVETLKIKDANVTLAKMANMATSSVIGRSTAAAGVPEVLTAGTDGHVLRRSGTTLAFGQIATAGITDESVTYAKLQHMTANSVLARAAGTAGDPADVSLPEGTLLGNPAGGDHVMGLTYDRVLAMLGLNAVTVTRKTADQTWNSDTALAAVTNLSVAVAANTNYLIEFILNCEAGATPDISFDITGPASPTAVKYGVTSGAGLFGGASAFSTRIDLSQGALVAETVFVTCFLKNGANAGTVQLRAAQRASSATPTTVNMGSIIRTTVL